MAAPTRPGRITVPADLDAVTDLGPEDGAAADPQVVERIWAAARHWYAAGMQPALQLCVRYRGAVVLNRAIGHARGNGPAGNTSDGPDAERVPVTVDTPFCVYSTAKATEQLTMYIQPRSSPTQVWSSFPLPLPSPPITHEPRPNKKTQ